MRRGQVFCRELPDQFRKLGSVPGQPGERPASRMSAAGRPYRIIRRNGEWFVEFTHSDARDRAS
jgi:hypothetical protein